jgi:sarcosine oxidase subunit delta
MKLLRCPINGLRPVSEFFYWGEVRDMPDPNVTSDEAWADYVFDRNGAPGIKKEWWYHLPSGVWFIVERDTQLDEVIQTYLFGQQPS